LLFATNGGLYFLDVVDYFINNFGVVTAGLVEVVLIAWFFKGLRGLQSHANAISDLRVGAWWKICLTFVTPIVLGYMMFDNIRQNLKENYEGYPTDLIMYGGLLVVVVSIVGGILLSLKGWKINPNVELTKEAE
jgi:neurotransmitter:Na+ symporter, NSS family